MPNDWFQSAMLSLYIKALEYYFYGNGGGLQLVELLIGSLIYNNTSVLLTGLMVLFEIESLKVTQTLIVQNCSVGNQRY